MATIKISDLRPAGADVFEGSESFMHDLAVQEINDVLGGGWRVSILWGLIKIEVD